jgi:hypothetical protein
MSCQNPLRFDVVLQKLLKHSGQVHRHSMALFFFFAHFVLNAMTLKRIWLHRLCGLWSDFPLLSAILWDVILVSEDTVTSLADREANGVQLENCPLRIRTVRSSVSWPPFIESRTEIIEQPAVRAEPLSGWVLRLPIPDVEPVTTTVSFPACLHFVPAIDGDSRAPSILACGHLFDRGT